MYEYILDNPGQDVEVSERIRKSHIKKKKVLIGKSTKRNISWSERIRNEKDTIEARFETGRVMIYCYI